MQNRNIAIVLALIVFGIIIFKANNNPATIKPISENSTIVAFGDSLTFGTGASKGQSYPDMLQKKISGEIYNLGIAGELSEAGLKRLPHILSRLNPSHVLLCHGGNDILQKKSMAALKDNLRQMILLCQKSGSDVILIAIPQTGLTLTPPDLYEELANEYSLPLDDSSLKEIIKTGSLKSDYVHPNARGYSRLADNIFDLIKSSEK